MTSTIGSHSLSVPNYIQKKCCETFERGIFLFFLKKKTHTSIRSIIVALWLMPPNAHNPSLQIQQDSAWYSQCFPSNRMSIFTSSRVPTAAYKSWAPSNPSNDNSSDCLNWSRRFQVPTLSPYLERNNSTSVEGEDSVGTCVSSACREARLFTEKVIPIPKRCPGSNAPIAISSTALLFRYSRPSRSWIPILQRSNPGIRDARSLPATNPNAREPESSLFHGLISPSK